MAQRLDEFLATPSVKQEEETPKAPKAMRLGDFLSMGEDTLEIENVNDAFYAPTSEEVTNWKTKGAIGYFEQAIRQDKTEMIPFNPEAAVKALDLLRAINRLKADKYTTEEIEPPDFAFAGSISLPYYAAGYAAKKIRKEKVGFLPEEQRAKDIEMVNAYLRRKEEERIRGYTIGGRITQGVAVLPGYMIEFLATGGLAALGRGAVKQAINPAIRTIAKSKALSFGVRNIGAITGAVYRTAAMPHRLTQSYAERQTRAQISLTEKGFEILKEAREKPYISAMKAFGDVVIENYSEVTGPALARIGKKIIPATIANNMAKIFKKLHPEKSIMQLFTKAGYHGFLEELGEERVGAFLRAITGVEDFGAKTPESMLDRIIASIPSGEEMLVEAGVLAFPGAMNVAVSQAVNIISNRKQEQGIKERPIKELSDEEVDKLIAPKEVRPEITPPIAKPEVTAPEIKEAIKPERLKPDISGITPLQKQIQTMEERKARVETAKSALEEIDTIREYFRHRITKYKKGYLKEELAGIPQAYIVKEGGIAPDEAMDELRTHFNIEVGDEAGLREYLQNLERSRKDLLTEIKVARPEFITKREDVLLRERIKATEQGIKEGRIQTKEEIKQTQTELIEVIEATELEAKDKAKFIRTIKNIQTTEQFQKSLPEITERLSRLKEEEERKILVNEIKKTTQRIGESPSVAIEYIQMVEDIIEAFELQKHKPETLVRLKETQEFIDTQRQGGEDVEMPQDVLDSLKILSRKKLEDVSTDDLRELLEKIESLERLGRTKIRVRRAVEEMQKQRALAEIKKESRLLEEREIIKPGIGERLSLLENFKNKFSATINFALEKDIALTPMDAVFDLLDGMKNYKGPNHRIYKQTIDRDFSDWLTLKDRYDEPITKLAEELKLDDLNFERIGIFAAKEQEGGFEKLLNSGYSEEEINKIILTEGETKFYRTMREKLDELRFPVAEVMRIIYNEPLGKVKNYFPFMTDFEAMTDSEVRERFGDNVEQFGMARRRHVERGFTKPRVGGEQRIRINAMQVYLKHIDNATYLVTVGKDTKWLGELATTDDYKDAVGEFGQEIVRDWIDLVARKGRIAGERHHILDTLRKHTGAAVLGFKLSSTLVQPTALFDGATLIGQYAFDGAYDVARSKEWRVFLKENFPELKHRGIDDPAFLEFWGKEARGIITKVERAGFLPLQALDLVTASSITSGAYQKYMREHNLPIDFGNPNKDAIDYAQLILRRTQSSAFFKDVPSAISRGKLTGNKSIDKAILQFQTFMLNRWSLIRHDMLRAGIKPENMIQGLNIFFFLSLATLAETGIRRLSKELIALIVGDDLDDWEETFTEEVVKNALDTIPILGSVVRSVTYASPPVPVANISVRLLERLQGLVTAKKPDTRKRNLYRSLAMSAGLLGMPGMVQLDEIIRRKLKEKKKLKRKSRRLSK